jgi:hypothetical protein
MLLTGDVRGKFTELSLFDVPTFDRDGPVLTRPHEAGPGFHVIAVLRSDYSGTRERYHLAFDPRLAQLGTAVLSRVINDDDAQALSEVGQFMLYELEDLLTARFYLERAFANGAADAIDHLAVVALFAGCA